MGLLLSKSGVRVQGAAPSLLPVGTLALNPVGVPSTCRDKEDSAVGGPSGLKQSDVFPSSLAWWRREAAEHEH